MQFCSKNFFLAAMLLLIVVPQCSLASPASEKYEWILSQEHGETGKLTVYIAPTGVRIVSLKRGFEIESSAPDWLVHCFRRQDKLMFTTKISEFTSVSLINPFSDTLMKKAIYKKIGTGNLDGLKYTKYFDGFEAANHVVWAADDIPADPHVIEVLSRYFFVPSTGKVPLYQHVEHRFPANSQIKKPQPLPKSTNNPWFDRNSFGGFPHATPSGIQVRLSIYGWKKVPYNAADFQVPTGCQVAKDSKQVLVSGSEKKELEEMMDSIGFTSDVVRGKK